MTKRLGVVAVALATFLAGCHSSSSAQHADAAGAGGAPGSDGGLAGTAGTGGADTGGADASVDPTTPDGFCRGYAKLAANLIVRCDGFSATAADMLLGDTASCAHLDASIAAGRASFDGTHARACLDELAVGFTCGGSSTIEAPDCTVVTPRVPLGGTCRSFDASLIWWECMGADTYCKHGPNQACDGTCTARAVLGQPCDLSNDVRCAQDLTCDSTTKTCVTPTVPVGVGAACDAATWCGSGLFCDRGADGGASGTCQAQKTSGPCATTDTCKLPYLCAGPAGAGACLPPKAVGDTCTPGQSECDVLGYCGPENKCTDTYVAAGLPCGRFGGENHSCARGAYCDGSILQGGTCRVQKQAGDACTGTVLFECGGNGGHCDLATHQCVACPY